MFDYHHDNLPSPFENFFTPTSAVHGHNTRSASKAALCVPQIRTNYGKFSIRYKGVIIWNALSEDLRNVNSRTKFKLEVKHKLFSLC